MAQLHESLYRSDTFAAVDLGAYIERLATLVFQTQGVLHERVRLALNIASVQVTIDQASVAGLLLNELITNCIKHGFPDARSGEVSVSLQPAGSAQEVDPQWCLSVSDTGIGIPIDFEQRRKVSLGMKLVQDLSKQLGGSLSMVSAPDNGATFVVVFAIQLPAPLVMPP
jgi:two-component sensor histidine kinase